MHWLLEPGEQDRIRRLIADLQKSLSATSSIRDQSEQAFPFLGRKSRTIAAKVITSLCPENGIVCDPFSGSGTFLYAALDCNRRVFANEWEPYAWRLSSAPFRNLPSDKQINAAVATFKTMVGPKMFDLYKTKCPSCGRQLMFDGLFFDRVPLSFRKPDRHERMGADGENVIFRNQYKCRCGCCEKHFDSFDQSVVDHVESSAIPFPDVPIIPNSRLNFTPPDFTHYAGLFSKRQQAALLAIRDGIKHVDISCRDFFFDTFLSIVHLGKYTDYRCKSQDNHCPPRQLKESNLYHRFLEKVESRKNFIRRQQVHWKHSGQLDCRDFREFLKPIPDSSISLLLTDPPYGDTAQYFEHAQRIHPFLPFSLSTDAERLSKEVVISDAPIRSDKHGKDQFLADMETLFKEAGRTIARHGFLALYFRPEQRDWITDLNRLKKMGRKNGLEPLVSIPFGIKDPSMRALASAAWTFKKDVLFIFLRLKEEERRWYEGDIDIDELVFSSAENAAGPEVKSFSKKAFFAALHAALRKGGLIKLASSAYESRLLQTLKRYANRNGAKWELNGEGPYEGINGEMTAEMRLREFAPEVVQELSSGGRQFSFEDYVNSLSSYLENGNKQIIEQMHRANRLVPELLREYAEEDNKTGLFRALPPEPAPSQKDAAKVSLRKMDPDDFERLIADWFSKRGYINVKKVGRSNDRGLDVLATNSTTGELEFVQCKRYREKNNVDRCPIQEVHSLLHTRKASVGWVITTSDFTKDAKDEAHITGIKLMNGKELLSSLSRRYPGKFRL